jgi:hypothetical protein
MQAPKLYWHKSGSLTRWASYSSYILYVTKISKGWYSIQIDKDWKAIAMGQENAMQIAINYADRLDQPLGGNQ